MRKLFLYLMAGVVILIMSIMGFFVFKISQNMSKKVMEAVVEETSMPGAERRYPREDGLVSLMPPYKEWTRERQVGITIEQAAHSACTQVGMKFDLRTSQANIGAIRHTTIAPEIEDAPFEEAMHEILAETNVVHEIENDEVVLVSIHGKLERTRWPVTLMPPYVGPKQPDDRAERISVQDAVMAIGMQAGFAYRFQESIKNTKSQCRKWIYALELDGVPFDEAMEQILGPVGITYEIDDDSIVLVRANG